jgi:hypothetical protein
MKIFEEKEAKEAGEKAEADKKKEEESTERDAGLEFTYINKLSYEISYNSAY